MRIRLVLLPEPTPWILSKYADRMLSELTAAGDDVACGADPDPSADVNHWLYYRYFEPGRSTRLDTLMITHVDGPKRLRELQERLEVARIGICMSSTTRADLMQRGVGGAKLAAILPAHDGDVPKRRIRIAIATRLYADGRKREDKLLHVAKRMSLDAFHFEIIGAGWEPVLPMLRQAGASVRYHAGGSDMAADYDVIRERISQCDYYLYTGEDEGSMGFVDALAAGVQTIVTPQGFHRDLSEGIDHAFWSGPDLLAIFRSLEEPFARRRGLVSGLTWRRYAGEHRRLWQALLDGDPSWEPGGAANAGSQPPFRSRIRFRFRSAHLFWRRVRRRVTRGLPDRGA